MSVWRKRAGILILMLVVLAAVLSALITESIPKLPKAALADGRTIEVKAITLGTNHVYGETKLQELLRSVLPTSWLGPKLPTLARQSDTLSLVAWIEIPVPTGKKPLAYRPKIGRFSVHADSGETFDSYRWLKTETLSKSVMLPLNLQVYPRRDSAFDLSSTVDGQEFKFRIPNPQPFAAQVSAAPSSIPVTNHAGDIVLRHGTITKFDWGSGPVLKFEYLRDGSNVTHEFDQWWTVTDLTGNHGWSVPTNEPIWNVDLSRYRVAPKVWDSSRVFEFELPHGVLSPTNSFSLNSSSSVGGVQLHDIWLGGPGTVIWYDDMIARVEPPPPDGKNQPYHGSTTRSGKSRLEWGRAEPWALINAAKFDGTKHYLSVFLIGANGEHSAGKRHSYLQWGKMNATMFSFPDLKDDQRRLTPPIKAQVVLQKLWHQKFTIDPAKLPRVRKQPEMLKSPAAP